MGTFGSRGGLHRVHPGKNNENASSCGRYDLNPCTQEKEPFIDLRKQGDSCETESKDSTDQPT